MNTVEYCLTSPAFLELVHALSLLLVAAAGYLTWRTHKMLKHVDEDQTGTPTLAAVPPRGDTSALRHETQQAA